MRISMSAVSMSAVCAIGLLGACQQEKPAEPAAGASASAAVQPPAPPQAPAANGIARAVKVKNDLYDFDYSYPAQAGAIPALRAWLDADLARQQAELVKGAKEDKASAAKENFPYNTHSAQSEWKVVTDLPGWLSLSAIVGDYAGGAHPNYAYTSLLWDKAAGKRGEATDLFSSKAALSAAIAKPFCDALDLQRAKKRGAKVNRASGDEFDKCIDPVESTIILGSSNKRTFDRIGVLVSPYSAGPYAEGDYEVTLPVDAAVLAAVKPPYRASFSAGR